uniref:Uncharacterized protein n=1 Tax=Strongyloides papillosus TaxID=174720 RepID=A0A0N5BGE2_STREA
MLNLYEPTFSYGRDFVLDDFLCDTNDHFDCHFEYRTNHMGEVKRDSVMDRFLDNSDALHDNIGSYHPSYITNSENH